jgi:poly-gamma-glutamate synthesis protein (capsule biosynthesis protein)
MRRLATALFLILSPLLLLGQDTITIAFIGDVMQHQRQLQIARIKGKDTLLPDSYDYSTYFKYTQGILSRADYAVANMEFVCGLPPYTGYPSFSAPKSLAKEAKDAGIDLFLCANNHILDKGSRGLEKSIETYDELGVPYTGAFRNRAEQDTLYPYIENINGIKCAFINFTYGTNMGAERGVVSRMDSISVTKAIARAKSAEADFIIALPHWGTEYSITESPQQRKWEDLLYRAGVDMIVGGHPHVIQPIRATHHNDGSIRNITAYSLGNYISNMSAKNTQIGFIFVVTITKDEAGCRILSGEPVWLWCARGGRFEKNYTTFPIQEFIDKPELFTNKYEYQNMVDTYNRLRETIQYGN